MSRILHPQSQNFKHIFESLEILQELQKTHFVVLEKPGTTFDKLFATLEKSNHKGLTLKFEDPVHYHYDLGDVQNLTIESSSYRLIVDNFFVTSIAPPAVLGDISHCYTQGFHKTNKYYFRLIIPLKMRIDFHYCIDRFNYQTKKSKSSLCIRIAYENLEQDLYFYYDSISSNYYLLIDSSTQLTYEQFSEYCFSTLLSFGYLTGKFQQDEGYYFSYDKDEMKLPVHFCYSEFRNSLFSIYTPVYSNAHSTIRDKNIANKIHKTLRPVSQKEFSKLCQWTYDSTEFASILILISEACTSSLLVMPSAFSVALEGLTDLLVTKNVDKLAPIKSKPLAKQIRMEFNAIIDLHASNLDQEGIAILKAKVEQINQLTNKSKLTKPFELLKFNLSKEDLAAIEHRNDFLHGRITLNKNDVPIIGHEAITVANQNVYYVAMRLYTLLSALILKSIGYDNKIVNHPKVHENVHKKTLNEEYFRDLQSKSIN